MLDDYQHLSEATVRKTLAPVLEKFRINIESTFIEDFVILDPQIFLGDKLVIKEYKCDQEKGIRNVLEQTKNYTCLNMSEASRLQMDKISRYKLLQEKKR